MIGGIIVFLLSIVIGLWFINRLDRKHRRFEKSFAQKVLAMHVVMSIGYYLYATFNPSDSHFYYEKVLTDYRGPTWLDFYGTSTTFIEFFGYPFIRFFGFSYEAMMAMFAFMGFLGFMYLYVFFQENIRFKHQILGFDIVKLAFLLPNIHFWSASFGKGAMVFWGIGLLFFALSRPSERWFSFLCGGLLVYHVRPHIMFVILASAVIGFTFSNKGVSTTTRVAMIFFATVAFFFIYQDVLLMVGISEGEEVSQGLDLTHRASELTKATSGVDITNYSLPMQLFTFLYRPLFVDAPGLLGLFVSFENLFYLIISFKLFNIRGIKFLITGNFMVKTAFFSFITVSIALAQISGNLGIAIRQKSQVMLLFLFVIIAFMDETKMIAYRKRKGRTRAKRRRRVKPRKKAIAFS